MEAISRKKEVDEMKTLAKEIGRLAVTKAGPNFTINVGDNWRQIGGPPGNAFVSSTYFDLAGLAIDDKTLFFDGATVQEASSPSFNPATAGNLLRVADIMTTSPITDTEAILYITDANFAGSPTTLTFDQTIYGRVRVYNMDLDNLAGAYAILLSDNQTGSLSATASDRIYCYRVVVYDGADGRFDLLAARYILSAHAKEEPEHQYLMRLKRSYELQNQPDRD